MKKLKIAITGGIGAGKSLVSNLIKQEGFPVLFSDVIAKDIMQSDSNVIELIRKEFGDDSYIDCKLNTKYLSEKVFDNEDNVDKINAIVHPIVVEKINEVSDSYFKDNNLVFIEIPLLFESGLENLFDYIILVYANENIRLARTVERSKLSEDEVKKRMLYQIPDEEKKDKVDFVIENNSTIDELKNRTNLILFLLKEMVKE